MRSPANPGIMQHNFAANPKPKVSRSVFNLSHRHLFTMDADYLYPVLHKPVYAGDTFKYGSNVICRLNTPLAHFFDNVYFDTFTFFVPERLLWENWEDFYAGETYTIPYIELNQQTHTPFL